MGVFNIFDNEKNKNEFDVAYNKVISFFPTLYTKTKQVGEVVLKYRKGQLTFSRQIMNAIRDNQIFVIQAGVGIGKTMGYLIPVFYTYDSVTKMKNFVISTSNIGLQQQLLTDINMVSNMLGIPIKTVIAKGVNNYACMKRIDDALRDSHISEEEKGIINNLLNEIRNSSTINKEELTQVSDEVWNQVKIKNRGACSKCSYSRTCLYRKVVNDIDNANIVVTNHNYLANALLKGEPFTKKIQTFIFDEAHQLESSIRDIQESSIDLDSIEKTLRYFIDNNIVDDTFKQDYVFQTILYVREFFDSIKKRACGYFYNNKEENVLEIVDCDKIPFYVTKLEDKIDCIIDRLKNILILVHNFNISLRNNNDYREIQLKKWIECFKDMVKGVNSQNIYWATTFLKKNNKLGIKIGYTSKKLNNVIKKIVDKNVPIIFTSGTLSDSRGTYNYFKNSLSLEDPDVNKRPVNSYTAIPSPYNYKKNSLFYYDTGISDPNENHQKYLDDLVIKIPELLNITHGRTLVLFTSKSDMNYVYSKINKNSFDFEIFLQGQQMSNQQLYSVFKDKNKKRACVFSTGAWEGLDVKGKDLSSVIITRLPFATDNAIMQYKQKEYKKDNDNSVYLNDMLIKNAQGTGRLIRCSIDKGIIFCLDSRFGKYKEYIKGILPFTNYTNDSGVASEFAKKNITNQDGPRGPYKKRIKKEDN